MSDTRTGNQAERAGSGAPLVDRMGSGLLVPAGRPVTMSSVFWKEGEERVVQIRSRSWDAFAAKCLSQDLDPLEVLAGFVGDFAQTDDTHGSDERRKAQEYVERAFCSVAVGEVDWWDHRDVALAWGIKAVKA